MTMLDPGTISLVKKTRKKLHERPELSGNEYETQKYILDFLSQYTRAKASTVGGTGVLAIFEGKAKGPTILLRADIDALPIEETNEFSYKSRKPGISHKCGHDGHTAILLGIAYLLAQNPLQKGRVVLLFQPSEETGEGAQMVLSDPSFRDLEVDWAFALHNLPGFKKHRIIVKEGTFSGKVKSLVIRLKGKTAHAAEPEKGHNPALAIAEILQFVDAHTHNHPESKDFFLNTPIYLQMGEKAYGVSAGSGEAHFTMRCWSAELMEKNCELLEEFVLKQCKKHNLQAEFEWFQEFYSNVNHPEAVRVIEKVAGLKALSVETITSPFKWGEDFGLFTQRFKGAMFGLGAGKEAPALHNPDYDFPDEIALTGINMFYGIIKEITKN